MKTFELDGHTYYVLKTAEEADENITDDDIEGALGWFTDVRGVPTEDFFDRLCRRGGWNSPGIEIERFDDPAAKRILSRARKMKREMDDYNLS